jgi:hypothetical protein
MPILCNDESLCRNMPLFYVAYINVAHSICTSEIYGAENKIPVTEKTIEGAFAMNGMGITEGCE